jgi:hypothetical protein
VSGTFGADAREATEFRSTERWSALGGVALSCGRSGHPATASVTAFAAVVHADTIGVAGFANANPMAMRGSNSLTA